MIDIENFIDGLKASCEKRLIYVGGDLILKCIISVNDIKTLNIKQTFLLKKIIKSWSKVPFDPAPNKYLNQIIWNDSLIKSKFNHTFH